MIYSRKADSEGMYRAVSGPQKSLKGICWTPWRLKIGFLRSEGLYILMSLAPLRPGVPQSKTAVSHGTANGASEPLLALHIFGSLAQAGPKVADKYVLFGVL